MQLVGRYEVQTEIGRGGMAIVYRARDTVTEREVALKLLSPQLLHDTDARLRFQREIKIAVRLDHPNIIPILDVGVDDHQPYIVLRLLTGGSLADRIRLGALPMREVVRILEQVAGALDEAHRHNVIHRDLKPSNVLFDQRDIAYLSDFGIAKALDSNVQLTLSGVLGTPAYMSPEQLRGDPLDGRSDQYALGILAFEMLTGRLPFEGNTSQIIAQHLTKPVPVSRLFNPQVPASVQGVLERVLAKEPGQRYPSASEFVAILSKAGESNRPISTPSAPAAWAQILVSPDSGPVTPPKPAPAAGSEVSDTDYVARLYSDGRKASDAGEWANAALFFEKVATLRPGYRDAERLLDAARQQLAPPPAAALPASAPVEPIRAKAPTPSPARPFPPVAQPPPANSTPRPTTPPRPQRQAKPPKLQAAPSAPAPVAASHRFSPLLWGGLGLVILAVTLGVFSLAAGWWDPPPAATLTPTAALTHTAVPFTPEATQPPSSPAPLAASETVPAATQTPLATTPTASPSPTPTTLPTSTPSQSATPVASRTQIPTLAPTATLFVPSSTPPPPPPPTPVPPSATPVPPVEPTVTPVPPTEATSTPVPVDPPTSTPVPPF